MCVHAVTPTDTRTGVPPAGLSFTVRLARVYSPTVWGHDTPRPRGATHRFPRLVFGTQTATHVPIGEIFRMGCAQTPVRCFPKRTHCLVRPGMGIIALVRVAHLAEQRTPPQVPRMRCRKWQLKSTHYKFIYERGNLLDVYLGQVIPIAPCVLSARRLIHIKSHLFP